MKSRYSSQAGAEQRFGSLISAVRAATRTGESWAETADLVADVLWLNLPGPEILTAEQRYGDPTTYRCHLLHAEPDGSFSVVALVWRPGQATPIHDHVTWCVFGVIQGAEYEERYTVRGDGWLEQTGTAVNATGDVTGLAPPATSTGCATTAPRPPSRCTSTAPTSAAWAAASAGSTTCLSSPRYPADSDEDHAARKPCEVLDHLVSVVPDAIKKVDLRRRSTAAAARTARGCRPRRPRLAQNSVTTGDK